MIKSLINRQGRSWSIITSYHHFPSIRVPSTTDLSVIMTLDWAIFLNVVKCAVRVTEAMMQFGTRLSFLAEYVSNGAVTSEIWKFFLLPLGDILRGYRYMTWKSASFRVHANATATRSNDRNEEGTEQSNSSFMPWSPSFPDPRHFSSLIKRNAIHTFPLIIPTGYFRRESSSSSLDWGKELTQGRLFPRVIFDAALHIGNS